MEAKELVKVEYEGHIFDPYECAGWKNRGLYWYISIGDSKDDRDFTTKRCPVTTKGGLNDLIKKAKKLNEGLY